MVRHTIALRIARDAGWLVIGLSAALFVVAAVAPLGLIRAYPEPPKAAIDGPLGLSRPIADASSLYRGAAESLPTYLERLTETVAGGMIHYWTAGDTWAVSDARYTGISIYDNYLLWLYRQLPQYRANFDDYEFLTPAKAIARGYGFCSQVSKLVYSILRDQGIEADIHSNPQHTVVEAAGNVLDSDYGVFIPHPLDWVVAHPEVIAQYYARFKDMVPSIRQAYALPWHVLGGASEFDSVRAYEAKFDRLKWIPPIAGFLGGLLALIVVSWVGRGGAIRQEDPRRVPAS